MSEKPLPSFWTVKTTASPEAGSQSDDLVENPFARFEEDADHQVPTATHQIYDYIAQTLNDRKPALGAANRASSATMCVKRRWYQNQAYDGKPLTPRKILNFALGDLTETMMTSFIKDALVGEGKLYSSVEFGDVVGTFKVQHREYAIYSQKTVNTKVDDDLIIPGHADGLGTRYADGKKELIEIKSSSNYTFKEFKENAELDYLKQAHALMMSDWGIENDIKLVRFFYIRKETGHLWDRVYNFSDEIADIVKSEFKIAAAAEEPQAPHGIVPEMNTSRTNPQPTGRMTIDFPCTYCPFTEMCLGASTVEWKRNYQSGNQKPIHIFGGNE